ncbi:FtsX-like permease family protein [Dactylosporangium sp. CA-052675]|uniref:ABC transporter permease n=1 Tax=Dactylosporangium sp. CA-052675 TaxID=3239927 RepID=UPI003D8A4679
MWALVIAGVRRRLAALSAIFVAAMIGAGLVVTAGSMFETGIRLAAPPQRLDAAPIIVIGDPSYTMLNSAGKETTDHRPFPERHRLDPQTAGKIGQIDGVAASVPVFMLSIGGPRGALLTGQSWASASLGGFELAEGAKPSNADDVVVSPRIAAAGQQITLSHNGVPRTYHVSGTVRPTAKDTGTVFFAEGETIRLSGDQRPDAVAVIPAPGSDLGTVADRVDDAVGDVRVLTGDQRGAAENPAVPGARTSTIVMGAVFGGIVLVVLTIVVSSVIGLSVRQRSREMSLLRAVGATGRQVRRLVVRETMIVGIAGTLAGLILGTPLAHVFFAIVRGSEAVPDGLELRLGPIPLAVAAAATTFVLWLASRGAARPARRARAIDALRDADVPRYRMGPLRWVLGIFVALGSIALGIITSMMSPALVTATSGPAVLAGSIAVALLAPAILRLGIRVSGILGRMSGDSLSSLAVLNARARAGQLATIAACAALVIGIGAGNLAPQVMQSAGDREAAVANLRADVVVDAPAGIDPSTLQKVRSADGVKAASAFVTSGGWIERPYDSTHRDRPWTVHGVSHDGAAGILENKVVTGAFEALTGDSIALPQVTAESMKVAVGDSVLFRFGDGEARELRVVALYEDLPGYETLLMPAGLVAQHTTSRATPQVLAVGDRDAVADAVADIPGLTVGDRDAVEEGAQRGVGVQAVINSMLVLVAIAYAAIAVMNTLVVSVLGRRREFALLRIAGATRDQARGVLSRETLIVTVTGVLAGLAVSAAAILPTAAAVTLGSATFGVLGVVLALLAVVALLVVPVTYWVARRVLAQDSLTTLTANG